MQYYFLQAKTVGDLTGVFLAHLDEKFAARGRRFGLPDAPAPPRKLNGFVARARPARDARATISSRRIRSG